MLFIDKWDFKDITKYTQSSNIKLMLSKDKKKNTQIYATIININTHHTLKTNYIHEKRVWEPKKCDMTYFSAVIIEEQLFKRFEKVH